MIDYIPLHVHSYFSFLDGASSPESLVERAQTLEMTALALTDHDALYGAVRFVQAAKTENIKPILGAEITLEGGNHLTLLAADQQGWSNLSKLISISRMNAAKGKAELPRVVLADYTDGLIALSGCRRGEIGSAILDRDYAKAWHVAQEYWSWFGDRLWIELQNHHLPEDKRMVADSVALAEAMGIGYVATNNVHYAERTSHRLQDVLVSIREHTPLDDAKHLHRPNNEYYLKSGSQMMALFAAYPQAITNSIHVANQCHVELNCGIQHLPVFPTPSGQSAINYLHSLCLQGVMWRFGELSETVRQTQ